MTLLYIEDDASNVRLVERILRRRPDIEVHVAVTGLAGVEAALALRPALILLDNRLPDASGLEVLGRLARDPATREIPVLILSGDTGQSITTELSEAGAAGFIAKPFDIQQFLAEIERHIT
ncbi:MAG TPA: response regulator [Streptosporangiaceae bacterium]|nr:response regulator [Streptosporangiaceae bacterium]